MTPQNPRRPSAASSITNATGVSAFALARHAKNLLAAIAVAFGILVASVPAVSAAGADVASQGLPSLKWFADFGLLTHAGGDLTGLGVNLRAGRYLGATDRLTLDIGVCFDLDPEVTGHFSYYYEGSGTIHRDGKIQINRTIVPVLFGWEHEWKTKSERMVFRLGPAAGVAYVNGKEERNPRVSNASNVFRSDSGAAFLVGVNAGLRWNFLRNNDRIYLDFSLAALGATGVKLEKFSSKKVNLSGGRLVIAAGLRF